MKAKDWWIYQERKDSEPWAIHVIARKYYRKCRADFTLYADWCGNDSKKIEFEDISIVSNSQEAFLGAFRNFAKARGHPLHKCDETQIRTELNDLKYQLN